MRTTLALPLFALAACAHVRTDSPPPPALEVMAYNVLFKGADDTKTLQAIAEESPDVLCITELTTPFAKKFDARFPTQYPHRKLVPKPGATGVGIYSRYPLTAVDAFPLPPYQRATLHATIDWNGNKLDAVCLHLTPPKVDGYKLKSWNDEKRRTEGAHLVKRLGKNGPRPTLVLGDFNEDLDGPALTALQTIGFKPACSGTCWGTFPGPALSAVPAIFHIDHITGRGVTFSDARTVRAGGSDHYPVSATLRLDR